MSKPNRRLPSGELTASIDEYVDAWNYLAKPLETILGWRLCAMDPGYTFEDVHLDRVNLTVAQVELLVEKLTVPKKCRWCSQVGFHTSRCYELKLNRIREALDTVDDSTAREDRIREVLDGKA